MTDRELFAQAVVALEYHTQQTRSISNTNLAIEALRARLAQPEPLPAKSKGALSHEENKLHNKMILDKFYEENAHLYKAQPEQEPVATLFGSLPVYDVSPKRRKPPTQDLSAPLTVNGVPMYPQREWQGLTDEEILEEYRQSYGDDGNLTDIYFAHAIEAKLKEKNHAA